MAKTKRTFRKINKRNKKNKSIKRNTKKTAIKRKKIIIKGGLVFPPNSDILFNFLKKVNINDNNQTLYNEYLKIFNNCSKQVNTPTRYDENSGIKMSNFDPSYEKCIKDNFKKLVMENKVNISLILNDDPNKEIIMGLFKSIFDIDI